VRVPSEGHAKPGEPAYAGSELATGAGRAHAEVHRAAHCEEWVNTWLRHRRSLL